MLAQGETGWSTPLSVTRANPGLLRALAAVLCDGSSEPEALLARCARLFGREWKFLPRLLDRYVARFATTRPRRREVVRFLAGDAGLSRAAGRLRERLHVAEWLTGEPAMRPVAAAQAWRVRPLATGAELASFLHVDPEELEWFTRVRRRRDGEPVLEHYRYRLLRKRSGSLRLIEEPKDRLKTMQRRILSGILDQVLVHPAVHGFVAGRSIVSFASQHCGQQVILRMDLKDFFPSVGPGRVAAFFRTAGYPERVADRLARLCLNRAPASACGAEHDLRTLYGRSHLPQGAPTSPALTNAICHTLDARLTGLAAAAGARYSRYADDLAFSGHAAFAHGVLRFAAHVAAVVTEEGFAVNHRKTRIMHQGVRQTLTGLVVNRHVNVGRDEFDRLKATLTNCIRHGTRTQNLEGRSDFAAHLAGRVSFVASINPVRGARLRALWQQVDWP